jgi:aspartate-semialdehyde dehydrogenase
LADTIALVGGETMLGREIREMLSESSLGAQVRLVAEEAEAAGTLTEIDGAAAFLERFDPDDIKNAAAIVLAGSPESYSQTTAGHTAGVIVDLTYAAEDAPGARVRAPMVEHDGHEPDLTGPQVIAHPAAIAITLLLERLERAHPIARSVIHAFAPASERGTPGVDELQQQTVALLSLQQMPKKVFDAQLSFNMLAQLGEDAAQSLLETEERIERHLATLLDHADAPPMPSLRLVQAPVFHGYSFSLWVEFEDAPTAAEVEDALSGESIDVRSENEEPPTNAGVAGLSGITAGVIAPDRNQSNAMWIWMVADNLRLAAENAILVLREIL